MKERDFQLFVKPVGSSCNYSCIYCYYAPGKIPTGGGRMTGEILERYIESHIRATTSDSIFFSWHGGEPTLAGLPFFKEVVRLQKKYNKSDRPVLNGIQTNGSMLDEEWMDFLSENGFIIGLSTDGPPHINDRLRSRAGEPTSAYVRKSINLLQRYSITYELLCTVNSYNSRFPDEVYNFLSDSSGGYITFLPVVEPLPTGGVTGYSVQPEMFGSFLCRVFDLWKESDAGRISVQIFDEAIAAVSGREHSLCIFREVCGGVPVVEADGSFYHCDHYVVPAHRVGNIMSEGLESLLDSGSLATFGEAKKRQLPAACLLCEYLAMCNGGCPKNRFIRTAGGDYDINYLCEGYRHFFSHIMPFARIVAGISR